MSEPTETVGEAYGRGEANGYDRGFRDGQSLAEHMSDPTPAPIDHRAEALRLIGAAKDSPAHAAFHMAAAQVHATLAAGTPVADQHLVAAARKYAELREAVRGLVILGRGQDEYDQLYVKFDLAGAMRLSQLVGGVL